MSFVLRPYQQEAVECAISWLKKSIEPCLIEAATGAGKSLLVSAIAKWIQNTSNKKVLCLAPSKELTEQNFSKYEAYGESASFFSASLGKSLRHHVVFGTPLSVKNSISTIQRGNFAAVIVDECHQITPTIKDIISKLKEVNPKLRVVGLSATPYRLNDGYIYAYNEHGNPVPEDQTKHPYFHTLVYRITAPYLIQQGYLAQPHCDPDHAPSYDTSSIRRHTQAEYERAFEGKGRKTAQIISDVVGHARGRMGVMIFAATVAHAQECMDSLLAENSRIITGITSQSDREKIIKDFKDQKFKYLVNVAVLTTGFDAPHVDCIAILRATESASLLQQIIGRGMRVHQNKKDCLVLDYAENIERHQLENDLFTPIIQAKRKKKGEPIDVPCPSCGITNEFSLRPNPEEFGIDDDGYFTDLAGNRIEVEGQPMPAHYGRRCFGYTLSQGVSSRCEHRWSVKECPECDHENDIAARFCEKCKTELVDPNEKLRLDFHKMKADPYQSCTDRLLALHICEWESNAGNLTIKADFVTEYAKFSAWFQPESRVPSVRAAYERFSKAYYFGRIAPNIGAFMSNIQKGKKPDTITYSKNRGSKYYDIHDYNQPEDKEPVAV